MSLAATFRPAGRPDGPAILLLHGVDNSREAVAGTAQWLTARGYATLAIDFRGHGQSTPRPHSFGWNEAVDAQTAFSWLKRHRHGAPIGVIGISMGGAASLLGEHGPISADALVLQAVYPDLRHAVRNRIATRLGQAAATLVEPFLSYQSRPRMGEWPDAISPVSAMRRYTGAVFVIGGLHDRFTPAQESRALYAAAPGPKSLWLVPEGDHAEICALSDEEYRSRVLTFFARTIGR